MIIPIPRFKVKISESCTIHNYTPRQTLKYRLNLWICLSQKVPPPIKNKGLLINIQLYFLTNDDAQEGLYEYSKFIAAIYQ